MKTANVEDIYELSPLQHGMLFHALQTPDAGLYFEQVTLPFPGYVHVSALRRAWESVVARHASLRSTFVWDDVNTPVQVVHRNVAPAWREEDWSTLPLEDQQARLERFLAADRTTGLDLNVAPLMRLALVRTGPAQSILIWSFHHLLLDGWSALTVLQEVSSLYAAYGQGREASLPPARPFSDYIAWLRKQDRSEGDRYWKSRLRDVSEPTPLGVDRASPAAEQGFDQAEISLTPETTRALRDAARQAHLTINTLIQGAWALLLRQYSGARDVVYGTVLSGRPGDLPGVQAMVGMFINTLPVRVHLDDDEPVERWLRRLQDDLTELQRFQHTTLVDVHGHSGVPRSQPLFHSILAYENYGGPEADAGGDAGARFIERTNYPLTAMAAPGAAMKLRVLYFTHLFERATIERLLAHWSELLTALASGPGKTLRDLSVMTAAERDTILREFSGVRTEYPRDTTITALFDDQVSRTPDAPAVTYGDRTLTYRDLQGRAADIGRTLADAGVREGDLVGVCVERSLDLVPALLGILHTGAAYLPLDPTYPPARLALMLKDANARVVLTQEHLRGMLPPTDARVMSLDGEAQAATPRKRTRTKTKTQAQTQAQALPGASSAESLAYVMYTSGSTGVPKGVAVPHRGVVRLVRDTNFARFTPADAFLQFAPISFDASTLELWAPLLNGGRVVVHPAGSPSTEDLAAFVRESGVTHAWFTAALFDQLVDTQLDSLRALRCVLTGGDVVSPARIRRMLREAPGVRIICGYGPTENTTFTTCHLPTDAAAIDGPVPIGRPVANTTVYVLDRHRAPVPIGVPGEIYTGGDGLARGYWNQPELTDERFVPDPFSTTPGARLYRTGDRGRFLANGEVEFLGRFDHQVKVRGFRIELGEIENTLQSHPDVRSAVVSVREDTPGDRRLVAYVVARDLAAPPDRDELRRAVGERLPEYMVPGAWVWLPELPLNANGKVDRQALPAPDASARVIGEEALPRTPTEEALAALWQDVLHVPAGIHDRFIADLGGHSLLATQLVSRIRHEFDIDLPLRALFEHPTIASLASVVEELVLETIEGLSDAEADRLRG